MKKSPWLAFLPFGAVFLALLVFSFRVRWWAPLLILGALVLQAGVVFVIVKSTAAGSYRDRAFARRERYKKDGDAAAWLAGEEREAASVGFRYWSTMGRAHNALNRADALCALERWDEAARCLPEAGDAKRLPSDVRKRWDELNTVLSKKVLPVKQIDENGPG